MTGTVHAAAYTAAGYVCCAAVFIAALWRRGDKPPAERMVTDEERLLVAWDCESMGHLLVVGEPQCHACFNYVVEDNPGGHDAANSQRQRRLHPDRHRGGAGEAA